MTPARGALERCVGEPAAFAAEDWGRRHRLHAEPGGFTDLLTLEDVDHMLSSMALRLPMFRLVKDGKTLPSTAYTKSGRTGSAPISGIADPPRIFELFRDGATIVLQGMHRFWRPLAEFCRELELALGHPTQVNGYITPPGSRGLAVHEDAHDVFVLQAFGRKHWEVWSRGTTGHGRPPALSAELAPGHSLYIPDRTPHAARTQDAVSGHLTVGLLVSTWADVLRGSLKETERLPALQERLPVGYHLQAGEFAVMADDRLGEVERAFGKLDAREVAIRWTRRFLTSRPPLSGGMLPGLLGIERIDGSTPLRRRPRSVCELVLEGDRLIVLLGDRELRMPRWLELAMRDVAGRDRCRPDDLAPYLDRGSRLVLARRLVREGLFEVEGEA